MSATRRPLNEILAPISVRANAVQPLQQMLARIATSIDRKSLILAAYETGALTAEDTRLLIEIYQLETA